MAAVSPERMGKRGRAIHIPQHGAMGWKCIPIPGGFQASGIGSLPVEPDPLEEPTQAERGGDDPANVIPFPEPEPTVKESLAFRQDPDPEPSGSAQVRKPGKQKDMGEMREMYVTLQ
jgi:hypothetical protein